MRNWITTSDFIRYKPYNIFAKGVGYESRSDSGLENYHTLFRKKFSLNKNSETRYILNITADDYCKLYINGELFSMGPASGYHDKYNYNELDVTSALIDGDNVIAVHVYYHGKIDYTHVSMDNRQGLWAELVADGQCLVVTDENWKYYVDKSYISNGVTWGYDTQFAENIDRRLHPIGWTQLDFDDSGWDNAVINTADDHTLVKQMMPPVSFFEVKPEKINKREDGTYILDFGKELVGYVRVKINSKNGGNIRIRCGEELHDDGSVRSDMRCYVNFDEVWTYAKGEDLIESYDYSGFRYLQYETQDETVKAEHFTVLARNYPKGTDREFKSNNELLQKIWDICKNAVIISTQEGYFDCPTREKGQYLGDLLITASSHYYITGDIRPYKKALYDFSHSIKIDKGVPSVAPASIRNSIVDYSLLFPLILKNYYKLSGDKETVLELIPTMEKVIAYYETYKREDGLIECVKEWNLVDWPDNLRDNYEFDLSKPTKLGVHNVVNAYFFGAKKVMNEIYGIVGIDKKYDVEALKKAYFDAFYNHDTKLFTDCEHGEHSALHSNVLPYYFGMTTNEQNEIIPDFIMEKGFSCGVYFSYFVLKSLIMHGKKEKAMKLLLNESEHSWFNMVKEGATSCFEAWGKDQKSNSSLCHPWASTPIIVLCEDYDSEII